MNQATHSAGIASGAVYGYLVRSQQLRNSVRPGGCSRWFARARAELADAVAPGRVVPGERFDLGRAQREGFVERRFEVTVVGGEDDEIDIEPLGFADHRQRAHDVDALLALLSTVRFPSAPSSNRPVTSRW